MTEYFKIGKFVSTFGLQGELILKHNLGKKSSLKGLQAIFIEEKKDSFIPYFIGSAKIKSDTETYVKFEGIDSKEAAHKLVQKEIWLLEDDFKKIRFCIRSYFLTWFYTNKRRRRPWRDT